MRNFEPQTIRISEKPIGVHVTKQIVRRRNANGKIEKVLEDVEFPVYRGMSKSLYRYLKSQFKYQQKLALRKREFDMLAENALKRQAMEEGED